MSKTERRKINIIWNTLAIAAIIGMFMEYTRQIAVICGVLLPIAAFLYLYIFRRGQFSLMNEQGRGLALMVGPFALLPLAIVMLTGRGYETQWSSRYGFLMAAGTMMLTVMVFVVLHCYKLKKGLMMVYLIVILMISGVYSYFVLDLTNYTVAGEVHEISFVNVTDKKTFSSRSLTDYYLTVEYVDTLTSLAEVPTGVTEVKVPAAVYHSLEVDNPAFLTTCRGFWGLSWQEVYSFLDINELVDEYPVDIQQYLD